MHARIPRPVVSFASFKLQTPLKLCGCVLKYCILYKRACKLLTVFLFFFRHLVSSACHKHWQDPNNFFPPYSFLLYDVLSGNKKSRKVMRQVPVTAHNSFKLFTKPYHLTSSCNTSTDQDASLSRTAGSFESTIYVKKNNNYNYIFIIYKMPFHKHIHRQPAQKQRCC